LSKEEILAILRRENELRLAPETQQRFKAASHKPDGWITVVEELQREVAEEFRLPQQVAFKVMREAESLLPYDVDSIREISLYRKYNRCVDGNLKVGDIPPDVRLYTCSETGGDGNNGAYNSCLMSTILNSDCRLVVLAGSYT
jgi:hypothetical protein